MDATQTRELWMRRFEAHLLQIRPDLTSFAAAECARSVYLEASDLAPEQAVDMYIDECSHFDGRPAQ